MLSSFYCALAIVTAPLCQVAQRFVRSPQHMTLTLMIQCVQPNLFSLCSVFAVVTMHICYFSYRLVTVNGQFQQGRSAGSANELHLNNKTVLSRNSTLNSSPLDNHCLKLETIIYCKRKIYPIVRMHRNAVHNSKPT